MTPIDQLAAVMPPPEEALERAEPSDWPAIEAKLRLKLPAGYKAFIERYGTGAIDDFLWVLNPFAKNRHLNLLTQAPLRLEADREFMALSGRTIAYPLYPGANGLFPWAITDNGDVLYWHCKGSPDRWRIVACDSRSWRWREFRLSVGKFLLAIVTRKLTLDIFPDDFPSEQVRFHTST